MTLATKTGRVLARTRAVHLAASFNRVGVIFRLASKVAQDVESRAWARGLSRDEDVKRANPDRLFKK
jgi:hypothetical protein